jgi:hypothetical protein
MLNLEVTAITIPKLGVKPPSNKSSYNVRGYLYEEEDKEDDR